MRITSERGYSLMDIVATLAFMAIILTMGTPQATRLVERYQVRGVTSQIGMELVRARMQAIAQNRSVRVSFADAGHYTVERSRDNGQFGVVVDAVTLPEGVVIESETQSITFDREGMTEEGVTLRVQRGDSRRTLSMNSIGRISES